MAYRIGTDPITFRYPGGPALLEQVAFNAAPGALTVLIGPNGAGKSTLLKIVAGALGGDDLRMWLVPEAAGAPSGGGARIGLESLAPRERARYVAYLPQNVLAPEEYRVEEIVQLGRFPHQRWWSLPGAAEQAIVVEALEAVDAAHLHGRLFCELSGGEQQSVLLASVLAQESAVLLLDEPGKALDIHHQAVLFGRLKAMAAAGRTVVAITHDLNIAARYADRLILMQAGRLVAEGSPREVLTNALLQGAYGPEVCVVADPVSGGPIVIPQGLAAGVTAGGGGALHGR